MRSSHSLLLLALSIPLIILAQSATDLKTTVVILGAGLAGITAAKSLALERNITDFLIIEALPEVDGGLKSSSIGGYPTEAGGNWIQGLGTNPIWALAQRYNVVNPYSNSSSMDYFDGNGHDFDGNLEEAFTRYEDEAMTKAEDISDLPQGRGQVDLNLRAGLNLAGWRAKTPYEKTAEYFSFDWEYAEPFIYNFEGFGDENNNFVYDKRGFRTIIQGQADEIPHFEHDHILYNQTVTHIFYGENGVSVLTADGTLIGAEFALCTFSIGVLQNTDADAIANFHMATYLKIFVQFPTQFWNKKEFSVYADLDERGHYSPEFEVKEAFMAVLRTMYGQYIPDPIEVVFHRWTLDPLFRGTFMNWGAGATVQQQNAIRAPVPDPDMPSPKGQRVFFAGEGTSRKYFGYLQGAYFEGRLASGLIADSVLNGCLTSEMTALPKILF
ncbi:FAD/NAD(P)-binding domain-containing protein [Pleomassaria siparia CBS 279.74]|uniref:FAD/NAD(P)-binding domain-containing protein n=1 Tax=Pleomassaria siparia CBS 279.74 TaxID=1314801 RepID=A0A6G1KQH6_9PLEO|nr:FAD/NAD(P)-binding domain-containing protein [Pleomassaria siparia CBS 279.74]